MRWNRIRSSAKFIHEKNICNFLNKINWSDPFTQLSIDNFLQKFVRVSIKKSQWIRLIFTTQWWRNRKVETKTAIFSNQKKVIFFFNFFRDIFPVFSLEFFSFGIFSSEIVQKIPLKSNLTKFFNWISNPIKKCGHESYFCEKKGFLQTEKTA